MIVNVAPATSSVDVPLTNTGTSTVCPGTPFTVSITQRASPFATGAFVVVAAGVPGTFVVVTAGVLPPLTTSTPGTTVALNSTIGPTFSLACSTTWNLSRSISYSPAAMFAGTVSSTLHTILPSMKL